MMEFAITYATGAMALALLLNVYRLVRGPDVLDRVVALDTVYVNSIALIVLYGVQQHSNLYFEVAVLIAMVGFVGTVMFAKYLLHGDVVE